MKGLLLVFFWTIGGCCFTNRDYHSDLQSAREYNCICAQGRKVNRTVTIQLRGRTFEGVCPLHNCFINKGKML
jgi:hypothetical protein